FSIVIAGLAVSAGLQARLGPLATAYVLALAVLGPPLTRAADPLAAILARRGRPPLDRPPSPAAGVSGQTGRD
ncbi:MAG TPA: cation:proton antiporter, partial [Actinomycetes bacterium]|nr:cation:proton antiporter [Actinomycetes bacterium]